MEPQSSPHEYLEKSWSYVQRLEEDASFLSWVQKIRKKYVLLDEVPSDTWSCNKPDCEKHIFCKSWKEQWNNEELRKEVKRYAEDDLGLIGYWWADVILGYVTLGYWTLTANESEIDTVDQLSIVLDRFEKNENLLEDNDMFLESVDLSIRPIAIRFSPYTSQKDLIKYINQHFEKYIKPLQETWKEEKAQLGKVKKKNPYIIERDDFIWEHHNKSTKEIARLLTDKYKIATDYSYVAKILSRLKKIRK